MPAAQANCKIADLLCLAEMQPYIWNTTQMTWFQLKNLLWIETSELERPLAFSTERSVGGESKTIYSSDKTLYLRL